MSNSSVKTLSPAHCVLLAAHLASESNISALHSFTPTRLDALDPELVLRIVLTYLPEAVDPQEYVSYIGEVASRLYLDVDREDVPVDTSPVKDLSEEEAERRVKKLKLRQIQPREFPSTAPKDLLTRFLCHRALRIDEETGLIGMLPSLIEPFLNRNDYIRTWYISVVLPLLRLEVEFYPNDETLAIPLYEFEEFDAPHGMDFLLKKTSSASSHDDDEQQGGKENIGRDIKSLVGPWMYGSSERKRRKLEHGKDKSTEAATTPPIEEVTRRVSKIELSGVQESDATGHDWEHMFRWMVQKSTENFDLIATAIENWDGPGDVDLGGYDRGGIAYLDEEIQRKLELQYAQAIFATCYAAPANSPETVQLAHNILARLAELLDFIPPPDLATSVDSLPRIERHAAKLEHESQTSADIMPSALLRAEHPLTTPRLATYMLLQMMVYSAYQFAGLGHALSLVSVAKLHFYATADEQLETLRGILRGLCQAGGVRKDESQWVADRAKLVWLWNWGIVATSGEEGEEEGDGAGVLGKIPKEEFEEEMLRAFVETSCYQLAIKLYIDDKPPGSAADREKVERIVIGKAMEAYDSASNGNRTRGGMKKAADIIAAFRPSFPESVRFQQATALIAATHAMSFYKLTLSHGVPFQPVSIRASQDPVSLISKLLEQNPRSYTKLDDLIDIARNLVSAGLVHDEDVDSTAGSVILEKEEMELRKKEAERRVTFMAVEASLREEDFETGYSYIVNRLTPSGRNGGRAGGEEDDDDISWRAAFLAGRYRPNSATPPTLRRLEQRTELLSLALLLAPTSALTEILAVWRRCEEETTSLQRAQVEAEREFDDRADKRLSGGGGVGSSALPGNFTVQGEQPELVLNQKRREMGRMGDGGEAPLSMFDLTRNAAKAFSKGVGVGGGVLQSQRMSGEMERGMMDSTASLAGSEGQGTVRKRDMVANAVSGGLASGLGWVLGATPVQQQQQHEL